MGTESVSWLQKVVDCGTELERHSSLELDHPKNEEMSLQGGPPTSYK